MIFVILQGAVGRILIEHVHTVRTVLCIENRIVFGCDIVFALSFSCYISTSICFKASIDRFTYCDEGNHLSLTIYSKVLYPYLEEMLRSCLSCESPTSNLEERPLEVLIYSWPQGEIRGLGAGSPAQQQASGVRRFSDWLLKDPCDTSTFEEASRLLKLCLDLDGRDRLGEGQM
jgi:hypothetical protein